MPFNRRKKLIALPVQVVDVPEGVVLKRGATEVAIKGTHAANAVRLVLNATRGEGASPAEIQSLFARTDAPQVYALIKNLTERHLLVPADTKSVLGENGESNFDVFSWNFGQSTAHIMERLNKIRLVIIGVNSISRQLAMSLVSCGHRNHLVLDDPHHRNTRFFSKTGRMKKEEWPATLDRPQSCRTGRPRELGDCLVATSDFGGQRALSEWNKICLDQKVPFLPVMLKNLLGYVGPFVVPGETPCFECLISRQRSHSKNALLEDLTDSVAFDGQGVAGFHPAMATILGDIAAFEITRFFTESFPKREPGQILEVDLLAGKMIGRTVIKVPRCAACSPLHKTSLTSIRKVLFPEDPWAQ